jgi:hypothetical protein
MGFRFRRSIRIGPGLRVNLSKSAISTSAGRRGAWFTFGPRGMRSTVGLPGTGLSYSEQTPTSFHVARVFLVLLFFVVVVVMLVFA